jgi:class 3 adenylate cyclase
MAHVISRPTRVPEWALIVLVILMLAGLPLAVWLDLRVISENALRLQADDLNSLITSVRNYYATNVVGRVLNAPGTSSEVVHNYREIPGAIPIPATLSLELGKVVGEQQSNIAYRFISDYPFKGRPSHALDEFERSALASLRVNSAETISNVAWSGLRGRVRLISPIFMGEACVACHNTHPDSPKRDWKVGDVRGIQEVIVVTDSFANLLSFKYLLSYFVLMAVLGACFIALQRRDTRTIAAMASRLETVAAKVSRYLAPQIYDRIFSGQQDVTLRTERKKLTVFFSDLVGFTAMTDRLQSEEVTGLLNRYLTEMAKIADHHGGTVDKFIGDAIVIFFGDPETRGTVADAQACLSMAIDMQRRVAELNAEWRRQGIQTPVEVRMGINTGYCDVGNFGSEDRMEYTVIGAEANLAARLQSIAEPSQIMLSYESYALVRDKVDARPLDSIGIKGFDREIVPWVVQATRDERGVPLERFSEQVTGLDFYFDPSMVEPEVAPRVRQVLADAIAALDRRRQAAAQGVR